MENIDKFYLINGSFEIIGSFMLAVNVYCLYRDKEMKGVHWSPTLFFAAWGLWNIFYYPHLEQWLSFIGGVLLVIVNLIWLAQIIYYTRLNKEAPA